MTMKNDPKFLRPDSFMLYSFHAIFNGGRVNIIVAFFAVPATWAWGEKWKFFFGDGRSVAAVPSSAVSRRTNQQKYKRRGPDAGTARHSI
jgi:hypothetical protein